MEALRGLPLSFAEDRLWRLQSENHSPHPMNLSNALLAFREEVERGRIDGLECVRRQSIWDRRRRDLVEDAAHLTADFKRRSFGVASGDFGLCLV